MCSNFFLAKTETLIKNPWDNNLKMTEYEDFFWRLKNNTNYQVFFTSDIQGKHIKNKTEEYEKYRKLAYTQFNKLVCQKYNLTRWVKCSPTFYNYIKKDK